MKKLSKLNKKLNHKKDKAVRLNKGDNTSVSGIHMFYLPEQDMLKITYKNKEKVIQTLNISISDIPENVESITDDMEIISDMQSYMYDSRSKYLFDYENKKSAYLLAVDSMIFKFKQIVSEKIKKIK